MSNRIFLDSSMLIEYHKGRQLELLNELMFDIRFELYFSQTVVSEFLFHLLAIEGGKSPMSVKMSKQIPKILEATAALDIFKPLSYLDDNRDILPTGVELMIKYNLLPNDALILSICKQHGVGAVASHDSDFEAACAGENLILLQNVADFEAFQAMIFGK